jgi:hypothetical protein
LGGGDRRSQLETSLGKKVSKTLSQETSWVWWCTLPSQLLGRQREEDHVLREALGKSPRPYLKIKLKPKKRKSLGAWLKW